MKKTLLFALVAITLCACGVREKISVVGTPDWKVETLSRVRVECMIDNRSCHTLRIVEGRLRIHKASATAATVVLPEEVVIPRRATTGLSFPVRVKLDDPLVMLAADLSLLSVSGEVVVKSGMVRKKIRIEDQSISNFLGKLAE